jgi:peptidase E
MKGTIVAIGGGGFSMSDDGSSAIDDYVLELTGKPCPRVCFVPTASGDADGYSQRFEAAFADRADASVLSLFCHQPWGYSDPNMLLEQDVVYVSGGSTANLLAVWRLHGLPEVLETAAGNGTVLAGVSAGRSTYGGSVPADSATGMRSTITPRSSGVTARLPRPWPSGSGAPCFGSSAPGTERSNTRFPSTRSPADTAARRLDG